MRSCLDSVGGVGEVSVVLPVYEVVRREKGLEREGSAVGAGVASPRIQVIPSVAMGMEFEINSYHFKFVYLISWIRIKCKWRERNSEHVGDVGYH